MREIIDRITWSLNLLAGAGLSFMVVLTAGDIFSRAVLGSPVAGAQTFAALLLVFVIFWSIPHGLRTGEHVRFELGLPRLPEFVGLILEFVAYCVFVVCLVIMIIATTRGAIDATIESEFVVGLVRAPSWPARIAIPIGLAALMLQILAEMVSLSRRLRDHACAPAAERGRK